MIQVPVPASTVCILHYKSGIPNDPSTVLFFHIESHVPSSVTLRLVSLPIACMEAAVRGCSSPAEFLCEHWVQRNRGSKITRAVEKE